MDMKLNSSLIRQEREKRAWSQEHLAEVTGLALRTIQRIESTGSASYESAGAIAAGFDLTVAALRIEPVESADAPRRIRQRLTWHPVMTLLGCGLVAATLTPPNFRITIPVAIAVWAGCEIAVRTRHRARPMDHS